jgi:hypothetical protein
LKRSRIRSCGQHSAKAFGLPFNKRTDDAIQLATLSGWLTAGGDPAHSVTITPEGLALLKERGMA